MDVLGEGEELDCPTAAILQSFASEPRDLRAALFLFDDHTSTLSLRAASGYPPEVVDTVRPRLVFRPGEERGLVGLVAETGEPVYVEDCRADSRWVGTGETVPIHSAYLVPLPGRTVVADVLCLLSPDADGIPAPQRALADFFAAALARQRATAREMRARLDGMERCVRQLAVEIEGARSLCRSGAPLADPRVERLRQLSPRELEILEHLRAGRRVCTIARSLSISPHTVRNHLKSIGRKLGARSQGELREWLGGLAVSRPLPSERA